MALNRRSVFVTIEGIEGSGKTTQTRRLAEALAARGHAVRATREPGGTVLGEKVRELLLHGDLAIDPRSELFLILAARAAHVSDVLLPARQRGEVVVCDRFSESTLAYQAYGRGVPIDEVRAADSVSRAGLVPDRTFILDLPVDVGLTRVDERRGAAATDRFEKETTAFHERIRLGFLELAAAARDRIVVLDAARSEETLAGEILETVLADLEVAKAAAR